MARATLAPILTSVRGKFGTASFSKGKKGVTNVRPRVTPANPRTAAWKAYAATQPQVSPKTGAKITVQGIAAYCGLADKFLQVTPGGTPPTTSGYVGDVVTMAAGSVGTVTVS